MAGLGKSALQEMALRCGVVDAWRRRGELGRGGSGVYLLFGHGVGEAGAPGLNAVVLASLLQYLTRRFAIVPLGRGVEGLGHGEADGRPALALTFDDGYANNLHNLLPVLRAHQAPATVFVTSGLVGTQARVWPSEVRRCLAETEVREAQVSFLEEPIIIDADTDRGKLADRMVQRMKRAQLMQPEAAAELRQALRVPEKPCAEAERMLTHDELQTLAGDPLITIGAHTVSHPILASLSFEQARQEIEAGRQALAAAIGYEPVLFAYPNGQSRDFTPEIAEHLRSTGWQAAVTTEPGIATTSSDPMRLPRLPLGKGPVASLAWGLAKAARAEARPPGGRTESTP
jgi:peptidoglycan/xylan/chitin deacetylase (PgdA/CDA1 family)